VFPSPQTLGRKGESSHRGGPFIDEKGNQGKGFLLLRSVGGGKKLSFLERGEVDRSRPVEESHQEAAFP